jgi:hypothetical protein
MPHQTVSSHATDNVEHRDRSHRPLLFPAPEHEPLAPNEREALRWALESCNGDVRTAHGLHGAAFAVLLRTVCSDGRAHHDLVGYHTRERLLERIRGAREQGEEPVMAYDVEARQPLTIGGGPTPTLTPAAAQSLESSPEKMPRH